MKKNFKSLADKIFTEKYTDPVNFEIIKNDIFLEIIRSVNGEKTNFVVQDIRRALFASITNSKRYLELASKDPFYAAIIEARDYLLNTGEEKYPWLSDRMALEDQIYADGDKEYIERNEEKIKALDLNNPDAQHLQLFWENQEYFPLLVKKQHGSGQIYQDYYKKLVQLLTDELFKIYNDYKSSVLKSLNKKEIQEFIFGYYDNSGLFFLSPKEFKPDTYYPDLFIHSILYEAYALLTQRIIHNGIPEWLNNKIKQKALPIDQTKVEELSRRFIENIVRQQTAVADIKNKAKKKIN